MKEGNELDEEYAPELGLMLQVDLTEEFIADLGKRMDVPRSRFEVRQIYSGPIAGVALYLPQAIGLFILSAYFGSMFAEMGKEHYEKIKSGAKYLWSKAKLIEVTQIGSAAKVAATAEFQLAFSITGQTNEGKSFKLVLKKDVDPKVADVGIDRFLDLVRDLNTGQLDQNSLTRLSSYREIGGVVVVTVDPKSGEIIEAVDWEDTGAQ